MGMNDRRDLELLQVGSSAAPDGGLVLQLTGELDLSTVSIFRAALDEILDGPPTRIEIDMAKLTFIDSSGVGAYVTAFRKAQANGSRLSIGARSELVQRVLQLSGVEEALAKETAENS
jgi:anti-anti-sigma factor